MWTAASIVRLFTLTILRSVIYNIPLVHVPQVLKAIRDLAAALHVPHHDDPAVLLNVRDNNKGRQSRGSSH
jgi:hypothetical protein